MEVNIETVAACKKKVSITIPREVIDAKFNERFKELEREAQIPGFRPGRAPRRLVEKRFRDAVTEEVRAKLVSEALEEAMKKEDLDVLGEPDVDPNAVEMPEGGPMTFSIEVEVRPEFELPEYAGIPIRVARPTVGDEDVARSLERLRESHGKLEPVEKGGKAKENDLVTGDLIIRAGDVTVVERRSAQLPVAAVAVEGIRLDGLPKMLKGAKAGETKTATITIGKEAKREDVRGKEAEVSLKIESLSRVAMPDDEALLKELDYENLEALRAALKRQLESQAETVYQRAQEEAVQNWLVETIAFELPADLAQRQADQLLRRHLVNLQYRGVPAEEMEQRLEEIKSASTDQAGRDLKLHFILDKIARKEKIEVTDAEVDARVRFIAAQYGRREDRVREEMAGRGGLDSLRSQIFEDKVLRMLIDKAKIEAPPPEAEPKKAAEAKAEKEKTKEKEAEAKPKKAAKAKSKKSAAKKTSAGASGEVEST